MPSLPFTIFLAVLVGLGATGAIVGLTAVLGALRPLPQEGWPEGPAPSAPESERGVEEFDAGPISVGRPVVPTAAEPELAGSTSRP